MFIMPPVQAKKCKKPSAVQNCSGSVRTLGMAKDCNFDKMHIIAIFCTPLNGIRQVPLQNAHPPKMQ